MIACEARAGAGVGHLRDIVIGRETKTIVVVDQLRLVGIMTTLVITDVTHIATHMTIDTTPVVEVVHHRLHLVDDRTRAQTSPMRPGAGATSAVLIALHVAHHRLAGPAPGPRPDPQDQGQIHQPKMSGQPNLPQCKPTHRTRTVSAESASRCCWSRRGRRLRRMRGRGQSRRARARSCRGRVRRCSRVREVWRRG
jgi:hypothetical protein